MCQLVAVATEMTAVATKQLCVRGYHVYKDLWAAVIGEELVCRRERGNSHNVYAVAVTKDGVIIGHSPRKISPIASVFHMKGGMILCRVLGRRRHSSDLPQGRLEIP